MTHAFAPPQARHAQPEAEPPTAFSQAFAEHERPFDVYDVQNIFGPGGKPIPKIAMVVPRIGEQRHAIDAAHQALATSLESTRADPDALDNEKQVEILFRACRSAENPREHAFPGPKWMRENLTTQHLAALVGLLAITRRKYGTGLKSFTPEEVDALSHRAQAASDEQAYAMFGILPSEDLVSLALVQAARYVAMKTEIEALRLALPPAESSEPAAEG